MMGVQIQEETQEGKKYTPFLPRHVVPLQLTHQFFHNSLYQDYTAGLIHCKEQNTLPCEEDKAIQQKSQAAKQEIATLFLTITKLHTPAHTLIRISLNYPL